MDEAQTILRIAQRCQRGSDALQAELGGLDLVAQRVKKLDRIGIVHGARDGLGSYKKNCSAVAMYCFISRRGTTASSMPCFSRNSLR